MRQCFTNKDVVTFYIQAESVVTFYIQENVQAKHKKTSNPMKSKKTQVIAVLSKGTTHMELRSIK